MLKLTLALDIEMAFLVDDLMSLDTDLVLDLTLRDDCNWSI